MSAVSIDLADAIAALLNAESNEYVMSFAAERALSPLTETELEKSSEVRVLVFPGARRTERATRGSSAKSYQPVVGIQRPLKEATPEANEQVSVRLTELVEQIEDVLDNEDLAGLSFVNLDGEQYSEIYNAEAMRDLSFFAAAIQLEYTSG